MNLKVACKKTSAGVVPMAGFPFYQLDRFLRILVQDLQKHVAISEEFANVSTTNEKSSGLMFDRRVARVVTPGTLIDEKFLDHSKNNFLLAVYFKKFSEKNTERNDVNKTNSHSRSSGPDFSGGVGLSWLDLSTGDFYTQRISRPLLPSVITKIGAKEILLDKRLDPLLIDEIKNVVGQDHHLLTNFTCELDVKSMSDWSESFESPISSELAAQFSEEETTACHILLEYVRIQMQGVGIKLQAPRRKHLEDAMIIDRNSLKGLEILETSRDGLGKGSLLHSVRRTSTKSGARLLRDRLSRRTPSPLFLIPWFVDQDF